MFRKIELLVILMLMLGSVSAISIGANPSSLNLEGVEPGEEAESSIYLKVGSVGENQTIEVNPSASNTGTSTIFSESYNDPDRVSEEGIAEWWSFDSTEIGRYIQISPEGTTETFNGRIDIYLDVPSDAEPGIRYGSISLSPTIETNDTADSGAGVPFQTGVNIPYSVVVQGDAERNIEVQDIRGFRPETDEASVEILLTNTGTVTTTADNFQIDVLNDDTGREVRTLTISGLTLEPGESEWTNAIWRGSSVEEGNYRIEGELSYFTGQAYASGSFELGDVVEVVPTDSPQSDEDEKEGLPIWLVVMVLVVLGVLMWSFDIEPFWILAIVGGLAIASFILLSGVSNYLLVVLLMVTGILFYGVM